MSAKPRLAEREAAQVFDETKLVPSEPSTIILSKAGWVRAAKGHDIDAAGLSYKAGDEYLGPCPGPQQPDHVCFCHLTVGLFPCPPTPCHRPVVKANPWPPSLISRTMCCLYAVTCQLSQCPAVDVF